MTPAEREAAAVEEVREILEKYRCILEVSRIELSKLLDDGSYIDGARYVATITAKEESADEPRPGADEARPD